MLVATCWAQLQLKYGKEGKELQLSLEACAPPAVEAFHTIEVLTCQHLSRLIDGKPWANSSSVLSEGAPNRIQADNEWRLLNMFQGRTGPHTGWGMLKAEALECKIVSSIWNGMIVKGGYHSTLTTSCLWKISNRPYSKDIEPCFALVALLPLSLLADPGVQEETVTKQTLKVALSTLAWNLIV